MRLRCHFIGIAIRLGHVVCLCFFLLLSVFRVIVISGYLWANNLYSQYDWVSCDKTRLYTHKYLFNDWSFSEAYLFWVLLLGIFCLSLWIYTFFSWISSICLIPLLWFYFFFSFLIVTRLAFVHARTCVYLFGNIQQCVLLCLVEWISRKLIYMYNCIICNAMRKMFQQNLLLAFSFTEKKHSNNGTQSREKEKNTNQMAPNHFHSISLENLEHLNKTI